MTQADPTRVGSHPNPVRAAHAVVRPYRRVAKGTVTSRMPTTHATAGATKLGVIPPRQRSATR